MTEINVHRKLRLGTETESEEMFAERWQENHIESDENWKIIDR